MTSNVKICDHSDHLTTMFPVQTFVSTLLHRQLQHRYYTHHQAHWQHQTVGDKIDDEQEAAVTKKKTLIQLSVILSFCVAKLLHFPLV